MIFRGKNYIQRATAFGMSRSRSTFASFTLKILFYIVPAVILGLFQVTFAGGFFIVLYFGIQLEYIHMIQRYIDQLLPPI